jgi:hypothetical protein
MVNAYKLLRDLPELRAGAIFEKQGNGGYRAMKPQGFQWMDYDVVESNPDWFTPLETESECEEIEHGVCCNKTLAQCNCGSEEHDRYAPIKMPEVNVRFITGDLQVNETFVDWMQSVTDTLNRHEQLLREGE